MTEKTTPKKERAAAMTTAQRFELMAFVKSASATTPDRTLAAVASDRFGRPISPQTITNYRKEFGIKSVNMPTREELQMQVETQAERILALSAALDAARARIHELQQRAEQTQPA